MTFALQPPPDVLDVPPWHEPPAPLDERLPHPLDEDHDSADASAYDDWDWDDGMDDCGLRPDRQCSMAGTEHCDWDCGRLG
jgi:hypothetical protein